MNRGNLARRGFLQAALGAMGAAGLPLWYAREVLADIKVAPAQGALDKFTMGIIGVGSPQSRSMGVYLASKDVKVISWAALCDVDARHLKRAKEFFTNEGFECTTHKDFR